MAKTFGRGHGWRERLWRQYVATLKPAAQIAKLCKQAICFKSPSRDQNVLGEAFVDAMCGRPANRRPLSVEIVLGVAARIVDAIIKQK